MNAIGNMSESGLPPRVHPKTSNVADRKDGDVERTGRPLDDSYVLGFLALTAWSDVELDCLAFIEGLVALTCDVGVVDENVLSAFT